MAQATPVANVGAEANAHFELRADRLNATTKNLDDGDYPSSHRDDEVDEAAATSESRPLLANDDQAAHLDDASAAASARPASSLISTSIPQLTNRKRRSRLKWTEIIWVTLTVALIAILGYSSQLFIMLPYYHKTPSFSPQALAAVLVPFNLGLLGIFYNYWLCVSTDPGSVPAGWEPEWDALEPVDPHAAHHQAQPNADGISTASSTRAEEEPSLELKQQIYRPRYCKTCSAFKPPRSHHCKTCQRCVLRMDHHCPWVANCVGHFNYAYFIRFLFWVDVTCSYHLVMISCRVLDKFNSYTYWREPSTRELIWLVVNYALCIPVIVLVGVFSLYHFYCVAVNQTTIESWEKDRTATMIRRGRVRKIKYPYDLGLWRNVSEVLGDNPAFWCLPVDAKKRREGEGLKYPVANGLDPGSQYRWPPKDPTKTTSHPYSIHGWRADGTQAPDLFASPPPPGATSTSPFTYGSGFNPDLRPTNTANLRYRGASLAQQHAWQGQDGDGSDGSSGSDDEAEYGADGQMWIEPSAEQLDAVAAYHGYVDEAEYGYEEAALDDHDDTDEGERRVLIRRGSEGYEVRPRAAWVV